MPGTQGSGLLFSLVQYLINKVMALSLYKRKRSFKNTPEPEGGKATGSALHFVVNRPKATLAAPYSLRPKPGATVSMPLHWPEVKKGLKMKDFTIQNSIARIKSEGDIFKPVLGKGIDLDKIIANL
jgi:bifunctional non-homologous end joining protein LigD